MAEHPTQSEMIWAAAEIMVLSHGPDSMAAVGTRETGSPLTLPEFLVLYALATSIMSFTFWLHVTLPKSALKVSNNENTVNSLKVNHLVPRESRARDKPGN